MGSDASALGDADLLPAFTTVRPLPGVATVTQPGHTITADLQRAVQDELDKAPPGTTSAALNVRTQTGVNLVFATKSASGKLAAALWIGKSGWHEPINKGWEGDVSIRAAWGGK